VSEPVGGMAGLRTERKGVVRSFPTLPRGERHPGAVPP
jgi:hypothetical protein